MAKRTNPIFSTLPKTRFSAGFVVLIAANFRSGYFFIFKSKEFIVTVVGKILVFISHSQKRQKGQLSRNSLSRTRRPVRWS